MGNLHKQCLSSSKPTDNPIICEIFNDTGTYITSCFSHDTIAYIKQCYVESCDPPPLPKNIIFKLLANPTFNSLKPIPSQNTEASKSCSPAFSYVSHSNTSSLQRVILLDDSDTMEKYKKYSLSMQKYSNKDNANDEAKRLIFQIRIEHISSKHKRPRLKRADLNRKRSNSTSTTINTTTMRQMYEKAGNMTPSDAYSVVSVESTTSFNFAAHLSDVSQSNKKKKKKKKSEKRKKYKLRRKVMKNDYNKPITEEEENDGFELKEQEEKSNIPLIEEQHDSAALDQFEAMINNEIHHKKQDSVEADQSASESHTHEHKSGKDQSLNDLNRPSTSIKSAHSDDDHISVRIIRRSPKKSYSDEHIDENIDAASVSAGILSPSHHRIQSPVDKHTKEHANSNSAAEEAAVTDSIITPQHPVAIPVVSSSSDDNSVSRSSMRNTNIIRSDRVRRERKRSNSFGFGNNSAAGEVFPLSLIYGERAENEGSVSYYHEHSYDKAMKFSLRKVKGKYAAKKQRSVKLSRRTNGIHKKASYGHSYSDREYSINSQVSEIDYHLFGVKEDENDVQTMKLSLSYSESETNSTSADDESICHQASQPPPDPQFGAEQDADFGPQSMRLDVFQAKGSTKFKRIRNLKDEDSDNDDNDDNDEEEEHECKEKKGRKKRKSQTGLHKKSDKKRKTKARRSRQLHVASHKKKSRKEVRKASHKKKKQKHVQIEEKAKKKERRKSASVKDIVYKLEQKQQQLNAEDDDCKINKIKSPQVEVKNSVFKRHRNQQISEIENDEMNDRKRRNSKAKKRSRSRLIHRDIKRKKHNMDINIYGGSKSVASDSEDDDAKHDVMDAVDEWIPCHQPQDAEHSLTVTTTFKRIEEKLENGQIEPGSTAYQQELDNAMHKLKKKHQKLAHKAANANAHAKDKQIRRRHKKVRNVSHQSLPPLYDNMSSTKSKKEKDIKAKLSIEEPGKASIINFSASASFSEKHRYKHHSPATHKTHRRYHSSSSFKKKKFGKEDIDHIAAASDGRRTRIKRIHSHKQKERMEQKKQYKQNKPHPPYGSSTSHSSRKEGQECISKRKRLDKYDKHHVHKKDKDINNVSSSSFSLYSGRRMLADS